MDDNLNGLKLVVAIALTAPAFIAFWIIIWRYFFDKED